MPLRKARPPSKGYGRKAIGSTPQQSLSGSTTASSGDSDVEAATERTKQEEEALKRIVQTTFKPPSQQSKESYRPHIGPDVDGVLRYRPRRAKVKPAETTTKGGAAVSPSISRTADAKTVCAETAPEGGVARSPSKSQTAETKAELTEMAVEGNALVSPAKSQTAEGAGASDSDAKPVHSVGSTPPREPTTGCAVM
jgi:hypothetical protein